MKSSRNEPGAVGWPRPAAAGRIPPLRFLLATVGLAACLLTPGAPAAAVVAGSTGTSWPAYLGGVTHDSFNAGATAITPSNASSLQPAWRWTAPASPNTGSPSFLASPTVYDGVIYIGAMDGEFYALDQTTRQVLWSQFLGYDSPKGSCAPTGQGVVSTATIATDPATGSSVVYVFGPDGNLYAMTAQTGSIDWKSVVDVPSSTTNDYFSWSSPAVANGMVYVGISSDCDNPLVPAGLVAIDQATGQQVAEWHSLPAGQVGASIWSSPAVLPDGTVIATTGNGYVNSGTPLYDESVVRLNGQTLQLATYWQVPLADRVSDGDFGASPTEFTANVGGVTTPMVGACDKNGVYYAFEQANLGAGPVWQARITEPYPGGSEECAAAAVWNGTALIEGGGAPTTIAGTTYAGSLVSLDPATGSVNWQTGLAGTIVGSPTEDGAGVIAAATYSRANGHPLGVYLVDAATGAVLDFITTGAHVFAQPVFVGNDLIVASGASFGITDYEVAAPGPPITAVLPSVIAPGTSKIVTLEGSGFSGTPWVVVSGGGVTVKNATVLSPGTLTFKATVASGAAMTPRSISVAVPAPGGGVEEDGCADCLTVGIPPPPPDPQSAAPAIVSGGGAQPVTLTGANFADGATVTSHKGISMQSVAFVSSSQLNLEVRVQAGTPAGSYNLFVSNPGGGSGECKGCLAVVAP